MKKVVYENASKVKLASFHSLSKGIFGECGLWGGYMEMMNFDDDLREWFTDPHTINFPNIIG